jgi:hypothetical protein
MRKFIRPTARAARAATTAGQNYLIGNHLGEVLLLAVFVVGSFQRRFVATENLVTAAPPGVNLVSASFPR